MYDQIKKRNMQVGIKYVNWGKICIPKLNGMPFSPALKEGARSTGLERSAESGDFDRPYYIG